MGPKMVLTRECQMARYEAHREDRAVLVTILNFTGEWYGPHPSTPIEASPWLDTTHCCCVL